MTSLFRKICNFHQNVGFTRGINRQHHGVGNRQLTPAMTQQQREEWDALQCIFIDFSNQKHPLPVPVYSNIKPTNASRFLFHVLLSMGEYDTEMELLTHANMRGAFLNAKLVNIPNLDASVTALLRRYILQHLCYYPIATKKFDKFLEAADRTIRDAVIHNTIPMTDTPSCLYTTLLTVIDDRTQGRVNAIRTDAIRAAYAEIRAGYTNHNGVTTLPPNFPTESDFLRGQTPWNGTLERSPAQTRESYEEQLQVRNCIQIRVRKYMDVSSSRLHKNLLIAGGPGCGKTHCLEYTILYTINKGLFIVPLAILADRAMQLGGMHFHKLFSMKPRKATAQHLAELAIISILKNSVSLALIQRMDAIAFDKHGNQAAELFSAMDIIFHRIRGVNTFMGGILMISTIDDKQLQPIEGFPILLSPHILTTFVVRILEHSVRAAKCRILRRIIQIIRYPYEYLTKHPSILKNTVGSWKIVRSSQTGMIPQSQAMFFVHLPEGSQLRMQRLTSEIASSASSIK